MSDGPQEKREEQQDRGEATHPSAPARASLLSELDRRHVPQTALIYAAVGFGLIEFVDIVGPVYNIPISVEAGLIRLVLGGFPVALLVAWLLEVGKDGLRFRRRTGGRASVLAVGLFAVVLCFTGFAVSVMPDAATADPAGAAASREGAPPAAETPANGSLLITASFRETPILEALATFAELGGRSIVPGTGVAGQVVTAEIQNDPWNDALAAVLEPHGLVATERGRILIITAPEREDASADQPAAEEPRVTIEMPSEWVAGAPVTVPEEGSVEIRGTANHRVPVVEVLLNGRPLAATRFERGGGVRFSGLIRAVDARFGDVVLVTRLADGATHVTSYPARVRAAPASARSHAAAPEASQAEGPRIQIHEPAEWAGESPRAVTVRPRTSVRVSGMAHHRGGVEEVRLNGLRMSFASSRDNPNVVQFSGFVTPPSDRMLPVTIQVKGKDGRETAKAFEVVIGRRAPTGPLAADFSRSEGSERQRWGVIIGIGDYRDPAIPDLRYAARDAKAFYDFLRSPPAGTGGIPEDNLVLLTDGEATTRRIRSALTMFLRRSTPDDVIVVFLVGHGVNDPHRPEDHYLLSHDSEVDDLPATSIPVQLLTEAVGNAYAYQKIIIADAVHSAGVGSGTAYQGSNLINNYLLSMQNPSGGFLAFTASRDNQLSREGEQFGGGHGVFTYYLLQGLNGAADQDKDGVVTLVEAIDYTRDRVRRETRNAQIPTLSFTSYDQFWPMAVVLDR